MKDYNCFADSLTIKFECPHCGNEVVYDIDYLPSPDWGADRASDSENSDDDYFACESCGQEFCIDIYVNIYEGNIVVTNADSNEEIEPIEIEEHYLDEDEFAQVV